MTRVSRGNVKKRTWTWQGKKRTAWYFDVISNGERVRRQYASQTEAEGELDAFREEQRNPKPTEPQPKPVLTLAQAIERYLATKARKRTINEDKRQLEQLKAVFGAEIALVEITAARISQYKADRLGTKSEHTGRPLTAAAVNRPLALLRHLLRLAHEEWEQLEAVPRIRLEKEPQGRIRWLEPDEEVRLLGACAKSQNKELLAIVTVALETGVRKGELLGLTWDRVDLSRGVIRLEVTKSGKRREVPMRQAVYDVLAAIPEKEREGRVWRSANIRTAFERAVAAAKLDAPFHFHDCRHHFASWFVMRGGNIVALQDLLGHASLSMTRRYSHLAPDHLRSEVAKTEKPRPAGVAVHSAHGTRTSHEVESGASSLVSA
jgi:integrase